MSARMYPNRTAAEIAAERETVARGFSEEQARKYSRAFFDDAWEGWTAWYVIQLDPLVRRPIREDMA